MKVLKNPIRCEDHSFYINENAELYRYLGIGGSIRIPDGVKSIASEVFARKAITNVTFPDSVIAIGDSAFERNYLTELTFPPHLRSIGHWAFAHNFLETISLPNNLLYIGNWTFTNNFLRTLPLPESLLALGAAAFEYNLDQIALPTPDTLYLFGHPLDADAKNDFKELFLHMLATSKPHVEPSASRSLFQSAESFTERTMRRKYEWRPHTQVITAGHHSFFVDENAYLYAYRGPGGELTLPAGIKAIANEVFANCAITKVSFPDTLETIGIGAFRDNRLETLVLPNSLTQIEYAAFARNALTALTLPPSLLFLGDWAFAYNVLDTIEVPPTLPIIGASTFANNPLTRTPFAANVASVIGTEFDASDFCRYESCIAPTLAPIVAEN